MRAAERLGDDVVDELEPVQPLGRDAHRFSGQLRLVGALPQNARAAFGGDDRVDAVLQHQHAVGDAYGERAAGAALADHDAHDRRSQGRHDEQIPRDGFALPALLGTDAGIRSRSVDQGDQRQAEFLGEVHEP